MPLFMYIICIDKKCTYLCTKYVYTIFVLKL